MDQSRRGFLTQVGKAGGYGAAYGAMRAMGIFKSDAALAALPTDPHVGGGRSVVVLGGGMAGLAAAYQLQQLGFEVTVLEAQSRIGGRVWTVRPGDRIEQVGWPDQVCTFDDGLYLNAGAGRLPGDHRLVMRYCKELGIPLEVLVNDCRSALDQSDAASTGRPVQLRQVAFDTRGRIAELLASATQRDSLDHPVSEADRAKLLQFLKNWGDLAPDYRYRGSTRAGYSIAPGAGRDEGSVLPPLSLETVMDPALYRGAVFSESYDMQATMFQPVGGMDHLPKALAARLVRPPVLAAEVTSIRRTGEGVSVGYRRQGVHRHISADYCVCTIPLNLLRNIPADFTPPFRTAIAQRPYENATKIVFQAPRFWEEQAIYGGLSFTGRDTKLVWYPSAGFHAERGILVAGYSFGSAFTRLSTRDFADRASYARETIEILHPGRSSLLDHGLQIEWGRVPHHMGSWASMDDHPAGYETLLSADGPIYFAGDHVSHLVGWIEGALASAHRVVAMMCDRQSATV